MKEEKRYLDLANKIRKEIVDGVLLPGDRLPSIRDCARAENLSPGTVKHAYTLLADEGLLELKQGRGSTILSAAPNQPASQPAAEPSRQQQALALLDELLDRLIALGFSAEEIKIFFDLKMRDRGEINNAVSVAVIDCNPETRRMIAAEFTKIAGVETFDYELNTVLETPEILGESTDVILTTTTHFQSLQSATQGEPQIVPLAMMPRPQTVMELALIPESGHVLLIALSAIFIRIMQNALSQYGRVTRESEVYLIGSPHELSAILMETQPDTILLPSNYAQFITRAEQETLNAFAEKGGGIVLFDYSMDLGSKMFAESRLQSLVQKKWQRQVQS